MSSTVKEHQKRKANQILEEGKRLAQRYDKYIEPMKEAMEEKGRPVDANIEAATAYALQSHDDWLSSMDEATRSVNAGTFADYGYKLITAILPNLVADEIVSIQPLKVRTGDIFYLDIKYQDDKGSISADNPALDARTGPDDNLHYSSDEVEGETGATGDGSSDYTFTLAYTPVEPNTVTITAGNQTVTDDGNGNLTGDTGGGTNTIDYSNGTVNVDFNSTVSSPTTVDVTYRYDTEAGASNIPQVYIDLEQTSVTAEEYKLRARYTLDAAWDLQQAHGVNADDELVSAMASIIRAEIDQRIMRKLRNDAAGGSVSFDATVRSGTTKTEHYSSFIHTLNDAGNQIYQSTRMAHGNFLICGTDVATIVEGMEQFEPSGNQPSGDAAGPYVAGTINGAYTVVKNPTYAADEFLVGFKGDNYLYSGFIFAPYRPLYTTPPVTLDDFETRRGLYTENGQKTINSNMYVTGTISNFP